MQIDWLTVSAQLINFLLLVWLLKRFLYRPVMDAMQRRERHIAARIGAAEQQERLADERERRYRDELASLEQSRTALLQQAADKASEETVRLLDTARTEVGQQREKWLAALEREQHDAAQAIRAELVYSASEIAKSALSQLADAHLERQVVVAFLRRLATLPQKSRAPFAAASSLRIASAFELADTERTALCTGLVNALGTRADVTFERDHALVCGIELSAAGHKLAWNLADFVTQFEARVRERLESTAASALRSSDAA